MGRLYTTWQYGFPSFVDPTRSIQISRGRGPTEDEEVSLSGLRTAEASEEVKIEFGPREIERAQKPPAARLAGVKEMPAELSSK